MQSQLKLPRTPITKDIMVWERHLDITCPVDSKDIKGFGQWVNWNGFKPGHLAFDFAAYMDRTGGKIVLGLPSETPIRAVADGLVIGVSRGVCGYAHYIHIEHGKEEFMGLMGDGLMSGYYHVVPLVEAGKKVKKGDIIATLYKNPGESEGRLVHLHFGLENAYDGKPNEVDPVELFPEIGVLVAEPQGSARFAIRDLTPSPEISISHFAKLMI